MIWLCLVIGLLLLTNIVLYLAAKGWQKAAVAWQIAASSWEETANSATADAERYIDEVDSRNKTIVQLCEVVFAYDERDDVRQVYDHAVVQQMEVAEWKLKK